MKTHLHLLSAVLCAALCPGAVAGEPMDDKEDLVLPKEKFDDPTRAFEQAKDELLKNYYREGLTEADLYRAAVQGMVSRIDPALHAYNQLLSPTDFNELQISMKGQITGIGVQIKFDPASGVTDVLGIIPGGPAEKEGLLEGDRILAIDGAAFKGRTFREVVDAIRGKEGSSVRLEVLRDAQVLSKTVRRERVLTEQVSHQRLPGDIELLSLGAFSERTPEALKKVLAEISASGAKGLIIDLRDNPGGLLDQAVDAAKQLLPKGTAITRLVHRGNRVETLVVDKDPAMKPLPTVVLIGAHTMSSAELIASALRTGLHAPLMGAKTHGKWSVQSLKELPNHYVLKYTVAVFQTPDGQSFEGTGLPPDVEVSVEAGALDRAMHTRDPIARVQADAQLRAALNLLRMRP